MRKQNTLARVLALALAVVMLAGVAPIIPMANAANVTPSSPNDTEMNSHYISFSDIDATKTTHGKTLATATGIWASHDTQAAVHVDQTTTIDGTPLNAAAFSLNRSMKGGWGPYNWGTSAAKMEYIKNAGKGTTVAALKAAGMKYLVFDLWVDEQVAAYTSDVWCILRDQYADEWNNGNEVISKTDLDNLLKEKGLYVDGNSYKNYVSTNSWNGVTTTVEFQAYLGDGRDGADRVMLDATFKGLKAGWNRIELSLDALYNNTKSITDVTHFMIYENQLVRLLVPDANPNMVQNAGAADGLNSTGPDPTAYAKLETKLANIRFWDGVEEGAVELSGIEDMAGVIPLFTNNMDRWTTYGILPASKGTWSFGNDGEVYVLNCKADATADKSNGDTSDLQIIFRNSNGQSTIDASNARYFMFDLWVDNEETATALNGTPVNIKLRSQYYDKGETWDDRQKTAYGWTLSQLNVLDEDLHAGWNRIVFDLDAHPFQYIAWDLSTTGGYYTNSYHYNAMKKALEMNGTTGLGATTGVTGVALTTKGKNDDAAYDSAATFYAPDGSAVTFTAGTPVFVQNPIDENEYFYYYLAAPTDTAPKQMSFTRDADGTFRRTRVAIKAQRLFYDASEFYSLDIYSASAANKLPANYQFQLKIDNVCLLENVNNQSILLPGRKLSEYDQTNRSESTVYDFNMIDTNWNGTREIVVCPVCSYTDGALNGNRYDAAVHTYYADKTATHDVKHGQIPWSGDGASLKMAVRFPAIDLTCGGSKDWKDMYFETDLYIPARQTVANDEYHAQIYGMQDAQMRLEITSTLGTDQAEVSWVYTIADYMTDANGNSTADWTDEQFVPGWYHIKLPLKNFNASATTGVKVADGRPQYMTATYADKESTGWFFNEEAVRVIRFSTVSSRFLRPAVSGSSYEFMNTRFSDGTTNTGDTLSAVLSATNNIKSFGFTFDNDASAIYNGEVAFTEAGDVAYVGMINDHGEAVKGDKATVQLLCWTTALNDYMTSGPVTPGEYKAIVQADATFSYGGQKYTMSKKAAVGGYKVTIGDLTVETSCEELSFIGDAVTGFSTDITCEAGFEVTPDILAQWYPDASVVYTVTNKADGSVTHELPTKAGVYDIVVSVENYVGGDVIFTGDGAVMKDVQIMGALDATANYALALDGTVNLKLYINELSETVENALSSYVLRVYNGEQGVTSASMADVMANGGEFVLSVRPEQMTDTFNFVIGHSSDRENVGNKLALSVQSYAQAMLESDSASAELKTLMINMLNYGAYAQLNADAALTQELLANNGYAYGAADQALFDNTADIIAALKPYAMTYGDESCESDPWDAVDVKLNLTADHKLEISFVSTKLLGLNVSAKLAQAQLVAKFQQSSGQYIYHVTIDDINALSLDSMFEVSTVIDGVEYKVQCGALSYVLAVLEADSADDAAYSDEYVNMLKALYLYNVAANGYYN